MGGLSHTMRYAVAGAPVGADPAWMPLTKATPRMEPRYGSSPPILSLVRPQRGSRMRLGGASGACTAQRGGRFPEAKRGAGATAQGADCCGE